jgi:RecA/RadA recombinase
VYGSFRREEEIERRFPHSLFCSGGNHMRNKLEITENDQEKSSNLDQRYEDLIPTGSTLLNLLLSDNPYGGYKEGSIVNIVGDSSAGKTFLLWTLFAEVVKQGLGFHLYYDEPEQAFNINIATLFNLKEEVSRDLTSVTVEDFHNYLSKAIGTGNKFIYGLDSFDSVSSEAEMGRDISAGSYKTEKPRLLSEILRRSVSGLKQTKGLLVVISQTREAIGVTFGSKKTRSGGKALKFYSTQELWLAVKGHIKRKDHDVGVQVIAKTGKNKLTGRLGKVSFPILWDYGVDDTASMIDWMVEEGFWKKSGRSLKTDYGEMSTASLINYIEKNNLESELSSIVGRCWHDLMESLKTERKRRY